MKNILKLLDKELKICLWLVLEASEVLATAAASEGLTASTPDCKDSHSDALACALLGAIVASLAHIPSGLKSSS